MNTQNLDGFKEKISRYIDQQVANDEFSGDVLITKNKEIILEYSAGFANAKKNIPIQSETKFNIGSMDKMFTGVAITQLAEQGKLSMQDKVVDFIPDQYKNNLSSMSIHHILSHTDGFPSYFNQSFTNRLHSLNSVDDYLQLFIHEPLEFNPGEKYQYSNSGYVVLGAIIEKVTGQTYYDYISKHVFQAAGMNSTGSFNPHDKDPLLAHGYTHRQPFSKKVKSGPRRDNKNELPTKGSPAGGGYSTCQDLLLFSQALQEFILLDGDMTKFILSPKVKVGTKDNQTLYYGYGFQILDIGKGHRRFGHAGSYTGANTRMDVYPWLGCTVIVLSNYDEPAAFRIADEAGKILLISES